MSRLGRKKCVAEIQNAFGAWYRCHRPAKAIREGVPVCGVHARSHGFRFTITKAEFDEVHHP